MMTPTSYLTGTALMLGGVIVDAFALRKGEDEALSALLWRAGGLLLLAGVVALCLSGCAPQPRHHDACHDGNIVLLPDGGFTVCGGLS